jgi:hypothetical protein
MYPTVGGIYPILLSIINHHLTEIDQDTPAVAKFKKDVHSDLVKRYHIDSDEITSIFPVICTFLDPRYRSLPFLTEPQRKLVHESVLERVDALQLPMSQPTADSPNIISQPGPRKRSKLNQDDMAFLLGGYFQATTSATPSNGAEELERYQCDKTVPLSQSPFLWWKLNMDTYPRLAVLARKLTGVPATSVLSERVFSVA